MGWRMWAAAAWLCAVAGCDCSGGQVGNARGSLEATPAALDFGTLHAGVSRALASSLLNKGAAGLTLARVQVEGDARSAFSVASPPAAVAGGSRVELTVTYVAPTADGEDAATLVVTLEDAEELRIPLTGKSTSACPGGPTESACGNGQDDDCDGKADCDDPDCAQACTQDPCLPGTELRVTNDAASSTAPYLAWNGSEYGIMWVESDAATHMAYRFTRAAGTGGTLGGVTSVTPASAAHPPSFSWGSGEYGVSWSDIRSGHNDIFFERLSAAGQIVGSEQRLTNTDEIDFKPMLAWNPVAGEWGAVWGGSSPGSLGTDEVVFQRLASDGTPKSDPAKLMTGNGAAFANYPSIVWDGTGYGVAWQQASGPDVNPPQSLVAFERLDPAGTRRRDLVQIEEPGKMAGIVVAGWTGSDYGLVWSLTDADGHRTLAFARISAEGVPSETKTIGSFTGYGIPTIAHGPSGWVVAWDEKVSDTTFTVKVARLTDDGTLVGAIARATCTGKSSNSPSLAFGNGEFGLAWSDTRDADNGEIYFKLLPKE